MIITFYLSFPLKKMMIKATFIDFQNKIIEIRTQNSQTEHLFRTEHLFCYEHLFCSERSYLSSERYVPKLN